MTFDSVRNFYENLVFKQLLALAAEDIRDDEDYLSDVACVALNHLPTRYIRHDVDMLFYTSPEDHKKIGTEVDEAVRMAIQFVAQRR